ncbi:MAG: SH3 domain-containing protein [Oscillospiraceae bacterium]
MDINTPEFWLSQFTDINVPLASSDEIADLNRHIISEVLCECMDLAEFPHTLCQSEVAAKIISLWHSAGVEPALIARLTDRCALYEIAQPCLVLQGVAVANAYLRTFPCEEPSTILNPDDPFDLFLQTETKLCERVVVLHHSADKKWYFVCTANACGWTQTENIALCAGEKDLTFFNTENFIIVTASEVICDDISLIMGTKLPVLPDTLDNNDFYTVLIPSRGKCGNLICNSKLIPKADGFVPGYLPFTAAAVIKLSFSLVGKAYIWGGTWDCSAMICDIFSCFGFALPRNTAQQAYIPCETICAYKVRRQIPELLRNLPPCSLIYMKGHVMLFLGVWHENPYCIHALWEAVTSQGNDLNAHSIAVTSLNLIRRNGKSFYDEITCIKPFPFYKN